MILPPRASAKYRPPVVRGLQDRTRLLDRLAGQPDARLVLIHAPAGHGKSTLAAQWQREVRSRGSTSVWLSIDPDDDSVVWFLSHLIEALRQEWPGFAESQLDLLEQSHPGSERHVVADLANEIEATGRSVVVILDDWHRVNNRQVLTVLDELLEMAPPTLQVVVTSRSRHGLPLGRLRVRGQLVEIDTDDLRFDREETAHFFTTGSDIEVADEDLNRLHETTDGWIAALQLVRLSIRGQTTSASDLASSLNGRHLELGEYLADSVLDGLDEDRLDFLLRTSITERICPDLAVALTGRNDAGALLDAVEADDLFLRHLDEERQWFRYHHLFVTFLRARLERGQPAEMLRLHAVAAAWYADNGFVPEAVEHALAAGQPELAISIVEDRAMELVEHSRMATLLLLAAKVPRQRWGPRPRLHLALAWAGCLLHRPHAAYAALEDFSADVGAGDEVDAELIVESDVCRACIDIYGDRIDEVPRLLGDVLDNPDAYRPWVVAVASNIQTFWLLSTFRFQEARQRQVWAWKYHERTTGPFAAVYGQCFVAVADHSQLDIPNAIIHARRALEVATTQIGRQSHGARLASALLGRLLYEQGDLDAAEDLLTEAAELGGESGVAEFLIATYCTLARLHSARSRPTEATNALREGRRIAVDLGLPRLSACLDRTAVEIGERPAPRHLTDTPSSGGIAALQADATLIPAVLQEACDRRTPADRRDQLVDQIEDAVESATESGRYRDALELRLVAAAALLRQHRDKEAIAHIETSILAAYDAGVRQILLDAPTPVTQLYRQVAYDLGSKVTEWLIGGQAVVPTHRTPRQALPVPRLSPREQLVLQHLTNGKSNEAIADALGISVNTVKWYLKKIYRTLGATTRVECLNSAQESGFI